VGQVNTATRPGYEVSLSQISPYNVDLPKGRVYNDTRLGLDGVALLGYPY